MTTEAPRLAFGVLVGVGVGVGVGVVGCGRSGTSNATVDASVSALHGAACGIDGADASDGIECAQYASALDAFGDALAVAGVPLVLAVGEVHAPLGAAVPSAARRFTDAFLPVLAGRASDLLVELMMPPRGCADAAAEVRHDQEVVTSQHAASDQDEYLAMGTRARALGIVPDMLRPSCADLDALQHAGDDQVDVSLTTIARLSHEQASRMVARDANGPDHGKMVVLYGGTLHNDLAPSNDAARWSYAPALAAEVQGRFVAIDLIVPEFVGTGAVWQKLAWWPAYDSLRKLAQQARLSNKATLFRLSREHPASFVLLFPLESPPP